MFLDKKYQSFYQTYGNQLFEQGPAVLAEDLNARLKSYLENDALIAKLSGLLQKYEEGEYELTDLDKTEYGISQEDRLFVKVDLDEKSAPKFFMWIMNDQFLWGDIDMEAAAALLKAGGQGTGFAETGLIGSIGSFLSGNAANDAGTDEEKIAALAGAFAQIAADKGVDPQIYFDKLDEIFKSKYGTTIKDFLETEFGGYGEIVSCNLYRRKISPDVMRGLNPWTILGDVILTVGTFGGSAAFTAGLKGAKVADAASKASKIARATGAAQTSAALGKSVKAIAEITRLSKLFGKLERSKQIASLSKIGVTSGSTIKYGRSGKLVDHTVKEVQATGVILQPAKGSPFFISFEKLPGYIPPQQATELFTFAGINLTPKAILAAKKAGDIGTAPVTSQEGAAEPGLGAKAAEVMGYYDTMAADPSAYIENAKNQGASDIASMLLDLKNGSGLFGNTTDQEEGCIALLITGLTPQMAKEVAAEYGKIDTKMNVYSVLDDELGGDISILAKAYWTGCTGEGDEYKSAISEIVKIIKKK